MSYPKLFLTNIQGKDTKFFLQVALAIVYQEDSFFLQLRDKIPTLAYCHRWGLFGGGNRMESAENSEQALKRELFKEIHDKVSNSMKYRVYNESNIIRYLHSCSLTVAIELICLARGSRF